MCSTPLPEGPANPVLTRMVALAPYQMPMKEGEAESERTKDGPYSKGTSDYVFGPSARGPSESCSNKDAGPGTIPYAYEGGQGGE